MSRLRGFLETLGLLVDVGLKLGAAALVVWILTLSQEVICAPPESGARRGMMARVVDFVRDLPVAEDYFARRQERCANLESLQALQDQVAQLKQGLAQESAETRRLRAALDAARAGEAPARPAASQGLSDAELARLQAQASEAIESASGRIARIYEQVTVPETAPERLDWAVVAGADRSVPAALDEVARLRALGLGRVDILLREGWYRTVARFPDREAAQAARPDIQAAMGRETYLRRLSEWCPDATPREEAGTRVLVCE